MGLFKKKCKHNWEYVMFQLLTDDNSLTYQCTKCGKCKQSYDYLKTKEK